MIRTGRGGPSLSVPERLLRLGQLGARGSPSLSVSSQNRLLRRGGGRGGAGARAPQVRQIKESLSFVSSDYERDMRMARETTVLTKQYTLPDGRIIKARRCMDLHLLICLQIFLYVHVFTHLLIIFSYLFTSV